MKGKHTVTVSNVKLQFTLDLTRNITILRGDSGTGKTTLVDMLRDYERLGNQSGVTVKSDKVCHILDDMDWESRLARFKDSIIFIDEGNRFVSSRDFASAIQGTDNYYVIITRESLYQLPYSVEAVLELKKTNSRRKRTYNKAYPYYNVLKAAPEKLGNAICVLTEDSNSGYEMFSHIASMFETACEPAGSKSKIYRKLEEKADSRTLVIADGAAFGAEMEKVYRFEQIHPDRVILYLPESFEWLILKSGIIRYEKLRDILAEPADYIDSESHLSWEQYFTDLLVRLSQEHEYMQYNKHKLNAFYLQDENVRKIIDAMQTE